MVKARSGGADNIDMAVAPDHDRLDPAEVPPEWVERQIDAIKIPAVHSRVRSGPMTFGPIGRTLLSVLPALIAFFAVRNIVRARHDATLAYYLVLGIPTLVLVGLFLAQVWKRDRIR